MHETSPAQKLRENVVLLVVRAIVYLTFLLYVEIGVLLLFASIEHRSLSAAVPTELWAAGAAGFGYISATLINTKHDATVQDPAPVQVVNAPGDPVPVDPQPDGPDADAQPPAEDPEEPAEAEEPAPEPPPARRRR